MALITFLDIFYTRVFHQSLVSQEMTISLLQKIGGKCSDAADRSVANKIPLIELQKLEVISKKANVLKLCMQDHDFDQSPAWLT